jgi:hypothetical protein
LRGELLLICRHLLLILLLLKSELLGLGLSLLLCRVKVIQIFQRSVAENNCWR